MNQYICKLYWFEVESFSISPPYPVKSNGGPGPHSNYVLSGIEHTYAKAITFLIIVAS